MERENIIIAGALVAAFLILRNKTASNAQAAGPQPSGVAPNAPAAGTTGGAGATQTPDAYNITPEFIASGGRNGSTVTPANSPPSTGSTSPTQDPILSSGAFIAMPKPVFDFA